MAKPNPQASKAAISQTVVLICLLLNNL